MYILYFYNSYHEYHHAAMSGWYGYDNFRTGEGFWMVPGTDPEDCFYMWRATSDADEAKQLQEVQQWDWENRDN